MNRILGKIRLFAKEIRFEHSIFALPFALISMLVEARGLPEWRIFFWIIVAMVGARSAAMMFNRIADVKIDRLNPRTAERALASGKITPAQAWVVMLISAGLTVFAAYKLNTLAFLLSPLALFALLFYSYTKRFTPFSHLWLGLCLGIAPVGACVAVRGVIGFASCVLCCAVMLWVAGFDVIYSLQDIDFDRKQGLYSAASVLGGEKALAVSGLLHIGTILFLTAYGLIADLGPLYFVGVALSAALLVKEHLTAPVKINKAFFDINGIMSVTMLAFTGLEVFIGRIL